MVPFAACRDNIGADNDTSAAPLRAITIIDVPQAIPAAPVPAPLAEFSSAALEWPRLRDYIATRTWSPLGRAWIQSLEPSADLAWIAAQHQCTQEMRTLYASGGSFDFHGLFDPTTLLEKARIEGSALEALEILSLVTVVERIAAWRKLIVPQSGAQPRDWPGIAALSIPIRDSDLAPLLHRLAGKIEPDGSLSDDASPELRRIRRAIDQQHRAIEESLRRALNRLSAEGSTQDAVITIRGDRFVIPVRAEFKRKVPGVVHGSSSSGQTVFVEPLDTIEQNNELVRLLDEEQSEIHRILVAMTRALAADAPAILSGATILAEIESHAARARFAIDLRCTSPNFTGTPIEENTESTSPYTGVIPSERSESRTGVPSELARWGESNHRISPAGHEIQAPHLSLTNARHPLLELRMIAEARAIGEEAKSPIPLTVALTNEARQLIISGPNTGGKTVSLKTIGLLALMAQAGVPVPADEAAFPLFTNIFADIGDAQSIERNLSSFSAHVVNLDRISRDADSSSLVLLDELGSATDPEEGAALAVAVSQHFLHARVWSCITTHLTSLKVYAANNPGVLNAAVGFDQETLTPTYQLRLGVPGASAGLNIASRLGLSPAIIAAARAQLSTQTADIAAFLDRLHQQLAAVIEERETLKLREQELQRERIRLDLEGRAEIKARTRELEKKLESLINDFEYQLRESVKAIDDKAIAKKIQRDSATTLARARREFGQQFKSTVVAHMTGADKNDPNAQPHIVKGADVGDLVKLKSLGRQGRVERIVERTPAGDAKTYEVAIGPMKMKISIDDIAEVEKVKVVTPLEAARKRGGVTISTAEDPDYMPSEINVIGRTADEAHDEVARFLDRAFLAGLPRIRIVHGTGMGILRRTLRDYLRSHPHVANVTEPPQNQGGQGATEVELRQ
ncbi:endonuclease MutS2 [Edaphobacter flagellatus]|uniref:endonuclease MutS2 n=1 Tax=Edaphobacter flagellatus TaxID=1933044 RepID=UPI0021B43012|nr:Smr/MutS family protein [Edaphobacter flagellatus]